MPQVIGFVLALSFVLLLVAFRSIVIPIKAILLNLLSTGAAFGLLVLVFQDGHGADLLGFKPGPIEAFVPVFIFTILFGLSMDYHVFILTRIKEARDHGLSSNEAVARGIAITAGTITSAAAIMVTVFGVFVTLELVDHQAARVRAGGRGAARRDDRPERAAAGHDAAARGVELVAAAVPALAAGGHDRGRRRRRPRPSRDRGRTLGRHDRDTRRHDRRPADRDARRSATSSPASGCESVGGGTFESRNPADGRDIIGRFQQGTSGRRGDGHQGRRDRAARCGSARRPRSAARSCTPSAR